MHYRPNCVEVVLRSCRSAFQLQGGGQYERGQASLRLGGYLYGPVDHHCSPWIRKDVLYCYSAGNEGFQHGHITIQ